MTNAARRTVVVPNDVGTHSQHFKGLDTEISSRVSRSQHEAPAVCTEAAGNFAGAA